MTTDRAALETDRFGAQRFERYLSVIVAAFGLLYALQTLDAFVADRPSMPGPLGVAATAAVAGSVLLGCLAPVSARHARALFLGAAVLFCAAVVVWPLSLTGPVPVAPMPWFIGLMPVQAAYLTVGFRGVAAPIWCSLLLCAGIAVALVVRGGLSVADALANGLFGVAVSVVLVVLISGVRRGVDRADLAQHAALSRYGQSRRDDATEAERARTDALVHDSVLTTFLAAASATDDEAEGLARRMAANALRVLAHVNRSAAVGPAVPFGKVLGDADDRLLPLLADFDVQVGGLADLVLPVEAAEAIVESLLQSMTSSLAEATDARVRTVRMSELGPDGIRVVVSDDGAGFDPADPSGSRARAQRDVALRMRSVDGRAIVESGPAGPTVVRLSWGSVVVSGVAPLPEVAVGLTA
ncbi:hypothetical protein [uncultured Amnibacterium sp.]|uniref:hypothetical protein n=1 Tax=uncultured Amnibacterium sp. TaxID=1631851 RepID=UPI0035C9DD05